MTGSARSEESSWVEHLEELRRRLIICVISVFGATVISYFYIDFIRDLFSRPVLSLVFFMMGALFAFWVVMPFTIRFFLGFASDQLEPMLSFSSYISYTLGLVIGFGLVFEMPVAVMILTRLGVISAGFLAANRMYATAVIFVAAAIFTPPDVISQLMMAIPMLGLYEVSILFARIVSRNKQPLFVE